MNSPITYFGGKGGMFKEIISEFPDRSLYNIYIEPFGGSFSVAFHRPYPVPVEIYNDLEKNVYSFFKVLSDRELFRQMKDLLDLSYYDETLRAEYIRDLREKDLSLVERAYRFFYVNRTSFNGVGGYSVTVNLIRRGLSKDISAFLASIDNLPEFHQRLSRVTMMNEDALNVMRKFDSPKTFMYLDPPYVQETRGDTRYKVDMEDEGHRKLIEFCMTAKSKIMISGYDSSLYDVLLENGFHKKSFEFFCTDKVRTETLWMNYESKAVKALF